MELSRRPLPGRSPRGRGDDGTAILEFTLVGVLLLTLVFGIINFGLILSFKQDMTRAAAEGARAGAVAYPRGSAASDAVAATETAVKAFGGRFSSTGCATPGMTCSVPAVAPCVGDPLHDCVTVELVYDYDNQPLYGEIPLIAAFLPNRVAAASVARIND